MTDINNTANSALIGIYKLLIIFFTFFALYFAQTIVILFALAALLTFLLSPFVNWLSKWFGEVFAVLLAVVIVFLFIVFSGYVFSKELILFGSNSGSYNEHIQSKLQIFESQKWDFFNYFKDALNDAFFVKPQAESARAVEVKVLDFSSSIIHFVQSFFGSFFTLLASLGVISLLVIFMLFNREDIRNRIIRFMGQGKVGSTINAIDDVSNKVYDFLFRQMIVNLGYGFFVSIGLYFIGVPNFILWGYFAAIFRFIPYIGPWIGAVLPIAFSFIIADSFLLPILIISYFVVLEIITANFIEPLYYSTAVGISSFAFIASVIFWTWFFGPIGLILATPLTVCLVVLGRHSTTMKFLSDLLSHDQRLNPSEDYYYRLLSYDSNESIDLIDSFLKSNSLISLYDTILIPVITKTENEFHHDVITSEEKGRIYRGIHNIIEFLQATKQIEKLEPIRLKQKILCIPGKADRDELGTDILAQFLASESFSVNKIKGLNLESSLEHVEKENPHAICMVLVSPLVFSYVEHFCIRLKSQRPKLAIVVCLLGASLHKLTSEKRELSHADHVAHSLLETIEFLSRETP